MSKNPPFQKPVLLDKHHVVTDFDCGEDSLNEYLKNYAYINNQNHSSRTYVACKDQQVAGYYTITPGAVSGKEVPLRVSKGLARYPVPIIILARLAVDKNLRGIGLGGNLLKDALLRIVNAADSIGGRAVLVHAKNDKAKAFYTKFGFEESPVDEFHLYLLLKDVKKTLGI